MQRKSETKSEPDGAARQRDALSLLVSMADVTWRMFLGPLVLVPVGLWADLKHGTKPLMTLLGLVLGLVISVVLVRAQLRRAQ